MFSFTNHLTPPRSELVEVAWLYVGQNGRLTNKIQEFRTTEVISFPNRTRRKLLYPREGILPDAV